MTDKIRPSAFDDLGTSQPRRRRWPWVAAVGAAAVVVVMILGYMHWNRSDAERMYDSLRKATAAQIATLKNADMLPVTAGSRVYFARSDVRLAPEERITIVLPPGKRWSGGELGRISLVRYGNWNPQSNQFKRYYTPICELIAAATVAAVAEKKSPPPDNCTETENNPPGLNTTMESEDATAEELATLLPDFDPKVDMPAQFVTAAGAKTGDDIPMYMSLDGIPRTLVLSGPMRIRSLGPLMNNRLRMAGLTTVIVDEFCRSAAQPAFPGAHPRTFMTDESMKALESSCSL